jgi:hypothetical protein
MFRVAPRSHRRPNIACSGSEKHATIAEDKGGGGRAPGDPQQPRPRLRSLTACKNLTMSMECPLLPRNLASPSRVLWSMPSGDPATGARPATFVMPRSRY